MKLIIIIAALLISVNVNAQSFTQTILEPVCDTFDRVKIDVISSVAPENGNLDSITIYWKKWSSKTGLYKDGNKTIANDTALVNPVKRKILQGAVIGYIPEIKQQTQKTASIRRSGN